MINLYIKHKHFLNYQHKSIWDYEILSEKLTEVGFTDVCEKKYKDGENSNLLLDLEFRRSETLYIECKS